MAGDKKLTELTLIELTSSDDLLYIVTYENEIAVSRAITVQEFLKSTVTGVNRIVSGQVIWTGIGYIHRSIKLIYELNGILYYSNNETITNDAPDGQDRFDVIFVDVDGLDIKKGTPAGSPTVPSLDNPADEISTNIVLVQNGESTPVEITIDTIYSENLQEVGGEWDTFESTVGSSIDLENEVSPINLTKDIKAILPEAEDYLKFNNSTPVSIADFTNIRQKFLSLEGWKKDYLKIEFYNGATLSGYGFINSGSFNTKDTSNVFDVYLMDGDIVWLTTATQFDEIRYVWKDGGGATFTSTCRFQLDLIKIETGSTTTDPEPGIIKASDVKTDTTDFDGNLSADDDTSQKAFETLNDVTPNQTHTGEVTGTVGLIANKTIISNKDAVTPVGADYFLLSDTGDSGNLKKALISGIIDIAGAIQEPIYRNADVVLDESYHNKKLIMSGYFDKTVTVPLEATEGISIGMEVDVVWRNLGRTTIVEEGAVDILIDEDEELIIKSQNNAINLGKEDTDEWGIFGALNQVGDTPFTITFATAIEVLAFADTSLSSLYWVHVYKSSDFPEITTTKDYFCLYSGDHEYVGGEGVYWGEMDDIMFTNFVEKGLIVEDVLDHTETPSLIRIPDAESGYTDSEIHLYYHVLTGDTPVTQETRLITSEGLLLHTVSWTDRGAVLGEEGGETHTGYLRVLKLGVGSYVGYHLAVGGGSSEWYLSTSPDGHTWTRGRRIDTDTYPMGMISIFPFTYEGIDYIAGVNNAFTGIAIHDTFDANLRPTTAPIATGQLFDGTRSIDMRFDDDHTLWVIGKKGDDSADNLHPYTYYEFDLRELLSL